MQLSRFIKLLMPLLAQMAVVSYSLAEDIGLRYDGVYVGAPFDEDREYCEHLRFYPQGTVITVSTICDRKALRDIKRWFRASKAGPQAVGTSRGKVKVVGEKISFTVVSREGKVAYWGGMLNDQLRLNSHSYINGNHDVDTYSFVRW